MKRFLFLVMFVFMVVMIYVSVHESEDEMPLPQKLERAMRLTRMLEYQDQDYDYVVRYPAFFEQTDDSLMEKGTCRFSFWKDMHLRYGITFGQNRMKIQSMNYSQTIDNWKQDLSIILPISPFTIDVRGEYYRNEITNGNYKDFFLADIKASYKSKRLDLTLSLNNLLNRDTYSYVITSDLVSSTSTNCIRGREVLLSIYYKPCTRKMRDMKRKINL